MSRFRLPPPHSEECLDRGYPSSQKGGTLIAAEVDSFEQHEQLLADPDGYRPERCPRCGHGVLHVHDYRGRLLLGDPDCGSTRVIRHRCAHEDCGAAWQTLPLIVARWLHRSWAIVQAMVVGDERETSPRVPERTQRRWWSRLLSSARRPRSVLASAGDDVAGRVAQSTDLGATRHELMVAWGRGMASLAALLHGLVPGLRLM
jgi:hypothetical protein